MDVIREYVARTVPETSTSFVFPGIPEWLPLADSTIPILYADFRTEGTTNHYWYNRGQRPGLSRWLSDIGGTFSRTSNAMMYDSSGYLTYAPSNYVSYSQDFSNAAWNNLTNVTLSFNIDDPAGGATAARVTATANAAAFYQISANVFYAQGAVTSLYLRRVSGSGNIQMTAANGGLSAPLSVTTSWQRFSAVNVGQAGNAFSGIAIATSGDVVDIAFAQAEAATYKAYTNTAGPYNPTASSAAYQGPRFDYYPSTSNPRGLLIESLASTNLLYPSENLDTGVWTDFAATSSALASTNPAGIAEVCKVIPDDNGGGVFQIASVLTTAPNPYTWSVFAKANGYGGLQIIANGNLASDYGATFNLDTGAVVGKGALVTSQRIENIGNGWYRCSATCLATAASADTRLYVGPSANMVSDGTISLFTSDTVSSVLLWGAQAELGILATSYIFTTSPSTALTRSADTTTLIPEFTPGSGYARFDDNAFVAKWPRFIGTVGGTEGIGIQQISGLGFISNTITPLLVTNAYSYGATGNIMASWDGAGRSVCLNNGTVATDANTQVGGSTYNFGGFLGAGEFMLGHISVFAMWNIRASDNELKRLTGA